MLHAVNAKLKAPTKNQTIAWGPILDWSELPIGMETSVLRGRVSKQTPYHMSSLGGGIVHTQ